MKFYKMNGAGNAFVIFDARKEKLDLTPERIREIANPETGAGADQIMSMEPSLRGDVFMRIWNADGGAVEQCGNAVRCVGWLLMEASGRDSARLDTPAGLVTVERAGPKTVTVDMGAPGLDWRDIPLEEAMDTRGIELQVGPIDAPLLHTPGAVSMGNPHVIFFVKDAETAPVREVGSMIEYHRLFPQRTNVEFCEVKARDRLRVRVWERGVGVTRACGTGACAALVAASRRNMADRKATVEMDGGDLVIEWRRDDDHVLMTGPIEVEFAGKLP